MQCGDSSVFSTEEHYAALLILVGIIHENFRSHCDWPIELPPLCKNVSKITKSNAPPYESVPEELWLLFHNVIISQLELGPPVDWLIEWPTLNKNMFKKSQNQTHVLTKVFPKNHLFRHSGHPTNLSGLKLILSGLWFNTIYLPMEFTSLISVPMVTYKSKLRHILAQQWAIVFKMYWTHFGLYSLFFCT